MPRRRPRRRARFASTRRCLPVAVVAATLFGGAQPAGAHAIVRDTRPGIDQTVDRSPRRVVMRFNEPVEVAFGAIRVYDTATRRVDRGRTHHVEQADTVAVGLEPDLAEGTYTVTWRVVSADGHPIEEAFVFHVGQPGEQPEGIARRLLAGQGGAGDLEAAAAGVARWLTFASLLVLVGAGAFLALVWLPAAGQARTAEVERRFRRRSVRVVVAAWAGTLVGTVAAYALQGAVAGDLTLADALSADVLGEVARTRFGRVALARLVLLVATALVGLAVVRRLRGAPWPGPGGDARRLPEHWPAVAGGVLALAVAATPALAGHAGTTSPVAANLAGDTLHVLAAACWMGGLVLLLAAAFPAARVLPGGHRVGVLAPVVARFSDLALAAVVVLVATGAFRSWVEVRSWRSLGESYGLVLLAKLVVVVPIIGLGFANNRRLRPRLQRATDREGHRALRSLRRNVAAEVVLGTIVVALTALLVNLAPARVTSGLEGPFLADVALGDHELNVLVDPNQVGENEVHLTATTASGAPAPVAGMQVLFRMPAKGIGPLVGDGVELGPGHFVVQGHQLSVAGRWVLDVVARTGRFDEARARVTVHVN